MPDGVVEKGSRAAGKVLRTGKEPAARVRPFGRVKQQSCGQSASQG